MKLNKDDFSVENSRVIGLLATFLLYLSSLEHGFFPLSSKNTDSTINKEKK